MDAVNLVFTICLFVGTGVIAGRVSQQWRTEKTRKSYDLFFPHDLKPANVTSFMRSISGIVPMANKQVFGHSAVVFETRANEIGIRHRMTLPEDLAAPIITQLRAAMPGVRITPADESKPVTKLSAGVEFALTGGLTPLSIPNPTAITTALLASLQPLGRGEEAVMQWVVSPIAPGRASRPKRPRRQYIRLHWIIQVLIDWTQPRERTTEQLAAMQAKLAEPLFTGVCRVGAKAGSRTRVRQIMRQTIAPLHITRTHAARFIRRPIPSRIVVQRIERGAVPILSFPVTVNAGELTALSAFPLESPVLPGLRIGAARQLPPSSVIPRTGHIIGNANFPGAERPIAIAVKDSLRHRYVVGPTGVGKSTLLINMVVQDMEAGRGVAVFDPKSDLIAEILDRIPAGREDDVVLIDPTNPHTSVGLNLLEHDLAGSSEVVVDQIVSVFSKLFAGFWGPRTADILRSSLLTLAYHKGKTIVDVPLLLQDSAYRAEIVSKVDDPVGLEPFWEWFNSISDKERSQAVGPVLNKLRALLLRKSVRDIFGQPTSSIQMAEIIAKRKILLVSLPKGQLGEDTSALTGSMLVMALWQAAMLRGTLPESQRTPFFCYIDEFQDFLNMPTGITEILSQARSFGFGLSLFHQNLGQLPRDVKDAVLANTLSKIVFQTSAGDARTLADEFDPYLKPSDLQNLDSYQAMAMVAVNGQKAAPVSITTVPAPAKSSNGADIRAKSLQRYGRNRADIEQFMRSRLAAQFSSNEIVRAEE